jgi:hypothetical protein
VVRCRAGAQLTAEKSGVPALRSGMKNAAPRPGHAAASRHAGEKGVFRRGDRVGGSDVHPNAVHA